MAKNGIPNEAKSSDQIRDAWENLGIAFAINESQVKNADPECTLLASLKELQEDRKLLKLILAWLAVYGDLVHVERIKALAAELSNTELAWLGGLSSHQGNDRRWNSVTEFVKKRLGRHVLRFQPSQLDLLQAERVGADERFQSFGITIPVFEAAESKKIRPRSKTQECCLWFRMRMLFGTNWRADVATLMLLGNAKTSYQAAQYLGCSAEAAYRNWNSLRDAGLLELLEKVA
jgi:hypothetical protein